LTRLAIFDYGAGNLHSLVKAIATENATISVEPNLRTALRADILILPGVGGFGAAVEAMNGAQVDLASALAGGLPCLGICLGMQLLFDTSEESSGRGIGLIPGRVERLRTSKVPHMGWNQIEWPARSERRESIELETAYFANSYICQPEDDAAIIGWTTHEATKFAAVVRQANTIGVQFHPEKSSTAGCDFVNALIEDLLECR
jgi:glutamine amidotransferase